MNAPAPLQIVQSEAKTEPTPPLAIVLDRAALDRIVHDAVARAVAPLLTPPRPPAPSPTDLLKAVEVQSLLRIDERTLRRMVREGVAPSPIRMGGRMLRWQRGAVERWIEDGARPSGRRTKGIATP